MTTLRVIYLAVVGAVWLTGGLQLLGVSVLGWQTVWVIHLMGAVGAFWVAGYHFHEAIQADRDR